MPDGLTYRLRLRSGLRFSDGVPFSADDVVFAFRAIYETPATKQIIVYAPYETLPEAERRWLIYKAFQRDVKLVFDDEKPAP